MTKVICINNCKPYFVGPFGIGEYMGNGESCVKLNTYYVNRCSNGDYYTCSEYYEQGQGAHQQPSFMGMFRNEYFVILSEWRDRQIEEILND